MKNYLFILIFLFLTGSSFAQSNYWSRLNLKGILNAKERTHTPTEYRLFSLNVDGFVNHIKNAPSRESALKTTETVIVTFPDADGNLSDYIVKDASIMHPSLQAKYPDIRSFVASKVSDPSTQIRFSVSPYHGLHGMIFSTKGISYIDSYSDDNTIYMVYDRNKLPESSRKFICEAEHEHDESTEELISAHASKQQNVTDGKMRTFRLALACTVEYSAYHINKAGVENGTEAQKKEAVLAAMNVTMTRVNGIYEKEVSLTMNLVPNNDNLIFITSDSYTNGSEGMMYYENPAVCNNVIGFSNYDIGHVFGTGDGGVAKLGSVCSYDKARGATCHNAPIGDPFDIDFVSHEMGHQYGANHTFNSESGVSGSCNSNNRVSATAVEPGSGSTIMAYAGICSVANVQLNSDAYFHAVSIKEIYDFITTKTCAATVLTGNNEPIVNAGQDYTIPKSTAYVLEGTATDPDGDTLTYCWEQTDTGAAANTPFPGATSGPNFRSFLPSTSPERYFPRLSYIIAGNLTPTWEVVPSVSRTLNYALTVRDNNPVGGQSARDDMKVTVNGNAGPFVVTSQNATGTVWNSGNLEIVSWDVANTNISPVNCANVKITLSEDGGLTFPVVLAASTPNSGSAIITVPSGINTTNARIMVKAVDNVFLAVNSKNFTVSSPMDSENITVSKEDNNIYPNPSSGIFTLKLDSDTQTILYSVFDASGRLIEQSKINNTGGKTTHEVNLLHLPSGVYIIQIEAGIEKITKKIIIKK
ncbi:MAG: M12 family metallo-peptidase [Flavobacteriaceae bacterium]|jgi:hypothetical protein|nr:M12 family metallo-peptidase [Flavobacteriaceae bacterium]